MTSTTPLVVHYFYKKKIIIGQIDLVWKTYEQANSQLYYYLSRAGFEGVLYCACIEY
jgi:hypothetical protein